MAYLKKDDSLDFERYEGLSTKDFIKEINKLTSKQLKEYWSNYPICEVQNGFRTVVVSYTIEEDRDRFGTVNAKEFMNRLKIMYIDK